ncbi:MAG: ethanolamine ammonia-lyase reactivating factor EutA [Lachnospiraceae bacterium]|nr:ethanolamine ammonia-lyase reactivating factor EutA [Lachnospiraceae bacterium]
MEILSVGIDIGTTTTQLVASRLVIENKASAFTVPRIHIVSKEIIYRSKVYFTPFLNELDIDGDGVYRIIQTEYEAAGLTPDSVATGAVIITGEAARKQNAEMILTRLSSLAGQFVVSTAGPDLESIIAGKGSGACAYSKEHKCTAVNADIGGGTTNIAVYENGETISCTCIDIGGRQVRVDQGKITYISPSARRIAEDMRLGLELGQDADLRKLTQLTDRMAELIFLQMFEPGSDPLLEAVRTKSAGSIQRPGRNAAVFLSGGVAACVFGNHHEDFPFGDIGVLLGRSIAKNHWFRESKVEHSAEMIRATVVGAGVHLVSISGSTITYTPDLLPLRNVPVLKLTDEEVARWRSGDDGYIADRLRWFSQATDDPVLALGWNGWKSPTFKEIKEMAERVRNVYDAPDLKKLPIILIIEEDMAKSLGQSIRILLPERKLICIDSVGIREGDYVDLGSPIMNGVAIPVVVKTLVMG